MPPAIVEADKNKTYCQAYQQCFLLLNNTYAMEDADEAWWRRVKEPGRSLEKGPPMFRYEV